MEKFQSKAIVNLQNTLHAHNIEHLINRFIKKHFREEEQPIDINNSKGIISYYDSFNDKVEEIKFEKELNDLLWNITNDIKSEIDLSNVKLTNKERVKFWNNILKSFDYIEETNFDVISSFPICLKPSEEIKDYLNTKYQFNQRAQFDGGSYFTLKPRYTRKDLENIFEFITIQGYLDDELYDFDDFNSSLFDKETEVKLTFNCKTQVLVCLLKEFSDLFLDFTIKKVSSSGRFLTKGNTVISESNYNTTVNRIKKLSNSDIDKIKKFFSENFS